MFKKKLMSLMLAVSMLTAAAAGSAAVSTVTAQAGSVASPAREARSALKAADYAYKQDVKQLNNSYKNQLTALKKSHREKIKLIDSGTDANELSSIIDDMRYDYNNAVSMLTSTVIGSAAVAEVPAYAYSSKKFKEKYRDSKNDFNTHAKQLSKEAKTVKADKEIRNLLGTADFTFKYETMYLKGKINRYKIALKSRTKTKLNQIGSDTDSQKFSSIVLEMKGDYDSTCSQLKEECAETKKKTEEAYQKVEDAIDKKFPDSSDAGKVRKQVKLEKKKSDAADYFDMIRDHNLFGTAENGKGFYFGLKSSVSSATTKLLSKGKSSSASLKAAKKGFATDKKKLNAQIKTLYKQTDKNIAAVIRNKDVLNEKIHELDDILGAADKTAASDIEESKEKTLSRLDTSSGTYSEDARTLVKNMTGKDLTASNANSAASFKAQVDKYYTDKFSSVDKMLLKKCTVAVKKVRQQPTTLKGRGLV